VKTDDGGALIIPSLVASSCMAFSLGLFRVLGFRLPVTGCVLLALLCSASDPPLAPCFLLSLVVVVCVIVLFFFVWFRFFVPSVYCALGSS
jgi:hypothetical protein